MSTKKMSTKMSKISNKKNPVKNCGIDLYYLLDNPDKSFINLPILNLDNLLDDICSSQEDFFYTSEIIEKNIGEIFSELSSNDIIYNYLINYNDIHNFLLKILIKEMKKKRKRLLKLLIKI
uniref:Uncharacterized protein n=1 Tax=viral metagenome TaxID=1070528 RepID=A0A6C0AFA4_9ZZZZ